MLDSPDALIEGVQLRHDLQCALAVGADTVDALQGLDGGTQLVLVQAGALAASPLLAHGRRVRQQVCVLGSVVRVHLTDRGIHSTWREGLNWQTGSLEN